jgi:hypothetical protein
VSVCISFYFILCLFYYFIYSIIIYFHLKKDGGAWWVRVVMVFTSQAQYKYFCLTRCLSVFLYTLFYVFIILLYYLFYYLFLLKKRRSLERFIKRIKPAIWRALSYNSKDLIQIFIISRISPVFYLASPFPRINILQIRRHHIFDVSFKTHFSKSSNKYITHCILS